MHYQAYSNYPSILMNKLIGKYPIKANWEDVIITVNTTEDKEQKQERDPHVGRIRPTELIVDDDANFEYHLNQDEFLRMVERNKKTEIRRMWRTIISTVILRAL